MIRLHFGYDIIADLPHGFTLLINKRVLRFHFDWPRLVWYNKHWAMDEAGYIQGMPVMRRRPKRWLLRGIQFPVKASLK